MYRNVGILLTFRGFFQRCSCSQNYEIRLQASLIMHAAAAAKTKKQMFVADVAALQRLQVPYADCKKLLIASQGRVFS